MLLLAIVIFSVAADGFLEPANLSLIVQQVMVVGTLGIAQTLIILTAGIDLSVGAIMVLSSIVMAKLSADQGVPGLLALLIGFGVGTACGLLNGALVTRLRLPPFIVTLGTLNVFFALNLYYSKSETVRGVDMSDLLLWTGNTINLGDTKITYGSLIMLGMFAAFAWVLKNTAWGRHVYAIGDDAEAARLAGVRTDRVLLSVYIVAGLICAVAAWMLIGRIASASPQAGAQREPRLDHGGRDRRHEPVRRARPRDRHAVRRADRRRAPQRPDACGHRRVVAGLRRGRAHHRGRGDRPVDPEGEGMTANGVTPILEARGLVKRYGHVTALAGSDFDLRPGEILAVIGDNGAGKSSLIKCLSGAVVPDEGEILLDGKPIQMRTPIDARAHGIETVYQTLAVSPSLDIADNLFLGREPRAPGVLGKVFRKLDRGEDARRGQRQMSELGIMTIQDITPAWSSRSPAVSARAWRSHGRRRSAAR